MIRVMIIICIAVSLNCNSSLAENNRINSKEKAFSSIKKYAELIGCNVQINPNHFLNYPNGIGERYVALVLMDIGCSGGSQSSENILLLTQSTLGDDFYININSSKLSNKLKRLPSVINKFSLEGDLIKFEGLDYMSNDALCCPSKKVYGFLYYDDNKMVWNILE